MSVQPRSSKFLTDARSKYEFLRIGQIVRVDYETLLADIEFVDASGTRSEVPLSQPMAGARSFLGGIPEVGSIVVVGFKRFVSGHGTPMILGYLPKGYLSQLNYDPVAVANPNEAPLEDFPALFGTTRYKLRKIYPGNILASSSQGSDLVLDRNVRLYSAAGDEVFLRADDHTFHVNTLNFNEALASGRRYSGLISRSKLLLPADIFDEDGMVNTSHPAFDILDDWDWFDDDYNLLPEVNFKEFPTCVLPNGKRYYVVPASTDYNSPYDKQTFSYVEDRLEINHTSDGILQVSEGVDGIEVDYDYPLIERVYGTYVGNSIYTDKDRVNYGKVLRPILFGGKDSVPGDITPSLVPCARGTDNEDERLAAAFVYRLIRPDQRGEIFIAHDKGGHAFYHYPATTSAHPLGEGKSVSFNTHGNVKAVIGKDGEGAKSLDITTGGSIDLNLGKDAAGYSFNQTLTGSANIEIRGKDNDGNGYRFVCEGTCVESLRGGKFSTVFGNFKEEVSGTKDERYNKITQKVIGEHSTFVGEKKSVTVKGNVEATYAEGIKETIIEGDFERENLIGNSKLTLVAGDQIALLTLGNLKETLTAGDRVTEIVAGNWKVSVTTGSVAINVTSGNIDIKTLAGNVTLDGLQVNVVGKVKVVIDAPLVDIGKVLAGGVVSGTGPPNPGGHLDYMTGMPLMGSPTVKV